MKDWYGNEYVASSWTRFVLLWQLVGFTARRTNALREWLANVETALKLSGVDVVMNVVVQPNFAGENVYGQFFVAGKSVDLTLWHYDTLTKGEINPAAYVMAALRYA